MVLVPVLIAGMFQDQRYVSKASATEVVETARLAGPSLGAMAGGGVLGVALSAAATAVSSHFSKKLHLAGLDTLLLSAAPKISMRLFLLEHIIESIENSFTVICLSTGEYAF